MKNCKDCIHWDVVTAPGGVDLEVCLNSAYRVTQPYFARTRKDKTTIRSLCGIGEFTPHRADVCEYYNQSACSNSANQVGSQAEVETEDDEITDEGEYDIENAPNSRTKNEIDNVFTGEINGKTARTQKNKKNR